MNYEPPPEVTKPIQKRKVVPVRKVTERSGWVTMSGYWQAEVNGHKLRVSFYHSPNQKGLWYQGAMDGKPLMHEGKRVVSKHVCRIRRMLIEWADKEMIGGMMERQSK